MRNSRSLLTAGVIGIPSTGVNLSAGRMANSASIKRWPTFWMLPAGLLRHRGCWACTRRGRVSFQSLVSAGSKPRPIVNPSARRFLRFRTGGAQPGSVFSPPYCSTVILPERVLRLWGLTPAFRHSGRTTWLEMLRSGYGTKPTNGGTSSAEVGTSRAICFTPPMHRIHSFGIHTSASAVPNTSILRRPRRLRRYSVRTVPRRALACG